MIYRVRLRDLAGVARDVWFSSGEAAEAGRKAHIETQCRVLLSVATPSRALSLRGAVFEEQERLTGPVEKLDTPKNNRAWVRFLNCIATNEL